MNKKVVVIGQGYVGLPLAIYAARANYLVIGLDIDTQKIDKLNSGQSTTDDIESIEVKSIVQSQNYRASNNFLEVSNAEIVLICVPTPLDINNKPDLNLLRAATKSIGQNLSKGTLVIIESTVAPGTTRDLCRFLKKNLT